MVSVAAQGVRYTAHLEEKETDLKNNLCLTEGPAGAVVQTWNPEPWSEDMRIRNWGYTANWCQPGLHETQSPNKKQQKEVGRRKRNFRRHCQQRLSTLILCAALNPEHWLFFSPAPHLSFGQEEVREVKLLCFECSRVHLPCLSLCCGPQGVECLWSVLTNLWQIYS